MYIEMLSKLNGAKLDAWKSLLKNSGLKPDNSVDKTALYGIMMFLLPPAQ